MNTDVKQWDWTQYPASPSRPSIWRAALVQTPWFGLAPERTIYAPWCAPREGEGLGHCLRRGPLVNPATDSYPVLMVCSRRRGHTGRNAQYSPDPWHEQKMIAGVPYPSQPIVVAVWQ